MYRLEAEIVIRGEKTWRLDRVAEAEITRDSDSLTATCRITVPRKAKWHGQAEIPVKRGDSVSVRLGYGGDLQQAFDGYVRSVGFKTPAVIECEDEMFRLKQMPAVKKAYRSADLETLLKDQGIKRPVRVTGEQRIGAYRVTDDTVASLLARLKETGVRSFFRTEGGVPELWCGVLFGRSGARQLPFATGVNIVDFQSLEQQRADAMRVRIRAISLMPDNTRIKIEAGDADGELRTLHAYNKNREELKAWAEQEAARMKRDGLAGSFTALGGRLADRMDTVSLRIDGRRMGVYEVEKNVIRYGTGGIRQEITIGRRTGE